MHYAIEVVASRCFLNYHLSQVIMLIPKQMFLFSINFFVENGFSSKLNNYRSMVTGTSFSLQNFMENLTMFNDLEKSWKLNY